MEIFKQILRSQIRDNCLIHVWLQSHISQYLFQIARLLLLWEIEKFTNFTVKTILMERYWYFPKIYFFYPLKLYIIFILYVNCRMYLSWWCVFNIGVTFIRFTPCIFKSKSTYFIMRMVIMDLSRWSCICADVCTSELQSSHFCKIFHQMG